MAVVRFMLKVVLLPVLLIVTLAEWIGVFLTSFASVLFYLFAGLCFILRYSYRMLGGTQEYQEKVLALAADLRSDGIDVLFDKWDLKEGHGKDVENGNF